MTIVSTKKFLQTKKLANKAHTHENKMPRKHLVRKVKFLYKFLSIKQRLEFGELF